MLTKKIYRESAFRQRVFIRTNDFDIQSIVGGTIQTSSPHGLISGDRVVLWFQGPRGAVFKTIATVLSATSFTVPDNLPESYTVAGGFHPEPRTGALVGEIFSYPEKAQVVPGKITVANGSDVAVIADSSEFNFLPGMTLKVGSIVANASIIDWVTTRDDRCGGCGEITHKLVLSTNATADLTTQNFSISGIDYTDTLQNDLQHTITGFTGDPLYGEIIFTVPESNINSLSQSDHLLQINIDGISAFREILTFTGIDITSPEEIVEGVYRTIFVGSVAAPQTLSAIKVASAFSIPASGGVTVVVAPSDALASGQTEKVSINNVTGNLSRSGSTYTFTRSFAGSIVSVPNEALISILGEVPIEGLAPASQGLTLTSKLIGLLPTGPDIDLFDRDIYTQTTRPSPSTQLLSGRLAGRTFIHAIGTENFQILAALLDDETFWFSDIQTKYLKKIPTPNQLNLVWGVESIDGKILLGVRADGRVYCQGLIGVDAAGSPEAVSSEGIQYLTVNSQVVAKDGIFSRQLTTLGENNFSALSPDESKIYFSSTRDGGTKRFWADRDGSNQFYAGLVPYLFTNKIFHLIWTGQSLSEGSTSTAVSIVQNYANLKFNGGVKPGNTSGNLASFVPLTENTTERGTVAFTNVLSRYAREVAAGNTSPGGNDNVFLCSAVGVGSRRLLEIKKNPGGVSPEPSYAHSIAQVQAGVTLAAAQGKTLEVPFIVFHHGESDDSTANQSQIPSYKDLMVIFWEEYNNDIKAITGQSRNVKILMSQMSSHTFYGRTTPNSAIDQYEVWEENPDKYTLVCSKYWILTSDGVHLPAAGYQALNEMMAIAASVEAQQGKPFKPVYPTSITRVGTVVSVEFNVPVWPLVLDTTEVSNPGNFGFEYFNVSGNPVAINSVAMGADKQSIVITLATATAGFLAYAYTGIVSNFSGPFTGARGNLRDSALYPSGYGHTLRNWCVCFYKGVS